MIIREVIDVDENTYTRTIFHYYSNEKKNIKDIASGIVYKDAYCVFPKEFEEINDDEKRA